LTLFGASPRGEIIASSQDPNAAFYQWLFETYNKTACVFDYGPPTNGHRWNILKSGPAVGVGIDGPSVGDFGDSSVESSKLVSGAHYPMSGASVEVWTNWFDPSAPSQALVNVEGTCTPLTRRRGTDLNGAWSATVGPPTGSCARYVFVFKDSAGVQVTYPSTGSLGIGTGTCTDWDSSRPPTTSASCNCTPQCDGAVCGDDGCGGSCGPCAGTCQAGACALAADAGLDARAVGADATADGTDSDARVGAQDASTGGGASASSCVLGRGPQGCGGELLAVILLALGRARVRLRRTGPSDPVR
jgi:hypothetical protein